MSYDVFEQIVGEVHAHSLAVDSGLVETWVRDVWSQCMRERTWSFLRRRYQLLIPEPYSTGTVTLDPSSNTAVFSGSTITAAMAGRQFRISTDYPIHEITAVNINGTNTCELYPRPEYLTTTTASLGFKIFVCYITPPSDFLAWMSLANMARRRRLVLHVNQELLDAYDSRRVKTGYPRCLSGMDYSVGYAGRVYPVLQVSGSGTSPTSSGTYTGQSDAQFVVKITSTGSVGTATFSAYKDTVLVTTGTTDSGGSSISEGVNVGWPSGTYTNGDIFVIRVSSSSFPILPRYELYPHPDQATTLQGLYAAWHPEIDDPQFVLPRPFTTDVIRVGALSKMARYPGTPDKPNPYSQIGRASNFEDELTRPGGILHQLVALDDQIINQSVNDGLDVLRDEQLPWLLGTNVLGQTEDDPLLYIDAGIYG